MQRTSVLLDDEARAQSVTLELTSRECIAIIIERGFATNISEAVRVSLAWCALAIAAYDGLIEQRATAGPRRPSAAATAPPRSGAARG